VRLNSFQIFAIYTILNFYFTFNEQMTAYCSFGETRHQKERQRINTSILCSFQIWVLYDVKEKKNHKSRGQEEFRHKKLEQRISPYPFIRFVYIFNKSMRFYRVGPKKKEKVHSLWSQISCCSGLLGL